MLELLYPLAGVRLRVEERKLAKILATTVLALVLIGLAALGSRFVLGYRSNLESIAAIGQPDTLYTWYLTVVWAAAAALSILLAKHNGRPDRLYWVLLSLVCLAASQEATVGAFERLVMAARFLWPIFDSIRYLWLAAVLSLFTISWSFISRQRQPTRRRFVVAFALYVLAVLIEGVGTAALAWLATRFLAHSLVSALGTGLRMSAASIVVYALWVEIGTRYRLVATPEVNEIGNDDAQD